MRSPTTIPWRMSTSKVAVWNRNRDSKPSMGSISPNMSKKPSTR